MRTARRTICQNNLKQVGFALHNFENAQKTYPIGARGDGTFRHSWWVDVLPFIEQQQLHSQLDTRSPNNGWVIFNPQNAQAADRRVISTMHCPSSPLDPLREMFTIEIQMPSYVGIAGASNYDGFPEKRVSTCCSYKDGQISAGGVLFPNGQIREKQIRDGLSTTIAVSETSNTAINSLHREVRIDGGFPNGWIMGTFDTGSPPNYTGRPCWNLTTIRYPPGTRDYELPGIQYNHGPNNPLLSAHPGGVYATMVGGSVMFLSDQMEVETLKRLATRDDGLAIEEF